MNAPVRPVPTGCLVGITGGYGAGKSAVASLIAERHPVLDSDAMAKEIIATDRTVQRELRKVFGEEIVPLRGAVKRARLADVVFRHPSRLQQLNAIVHPAVVERITRDAAALFAQGTPIVFVESALIFEAGIEQLFTYVLAVVAKPETVLARLEHAGQTRDAARLRQQHQLDPAAKAERADFLIRNDGTMEELRVSVRFMLSLIGTLCAKG